VHDAALALETGDRTAAAALTSWPPDGMRPVRRAAIHGLAVALARHDRDPAAALAHLEAMAGLGDTEGPDQNAWAEDLLVAGRTALAAGADPATVRRLTEPGSANILGCPSHLGRAWPAHLEAALLEAEGDPAGALLAALEAVAADGELRPPPVRADLHLVLTRTYLAAGDAAQARAAARTARELLGRWPGWRRDEADALLRRLHPAKSDAAASEDPGTLTPREREVAALVAEGLSNGQIGQRLYISTKTASVHVSNILAKLSMSSRAEIAAWVAGGAGTRPSSP
jgi:DNA-binding NarL/FixJ family response regulator